MLDDLCLDPLLIELLKRVPSAERGWPGLQRVQWFRTFAMNVSQIYDGGDGEAVEVKIELEDGPPEMVEYPRIRKGGGDAG